MMSRDFFIRTDNALGKAVEKQAKREKRSFSGLITFAIVKHLRDVDAITEAEATHAMRLKRPGRKPKANKGK